MNMNNIVLVNFMESTNYVGFFCDTINILLVLLGVLLICMELFIPGGIAGAIGFCIAFGTILFRTDSMWDFLIVSFMVSILTIGICYLVWNMIPRKLRNKTLYLQTQLSKQDGFSSASDKGDYVKKQGVAKSVLRPSGKIQIDEEILDAQAEQAFIDAGKDIVVIGVEGNRLIVRELL